MRITSEDLDPHVAQTIMLGLAGSFSKRDPSTDERRLQQAERKRFKADFHPLMRWMIGGAVAASAAAASVFGFGLDPGVAIGTSIGLWNGIFWGSFAVGMFRSVKVSHERGNVVHSDLLAQWMPFLELSRAERAYCETVVLLAKPRSQIDAVTGRQILTDLNALMERIRHLEEQRAEILRVAGTESIRGLEEEQARISARLAAAQDPMARTDLDESLALCRARLESSRQMTPAIERVDAQLEKIVQTLASLQSRLARLESAPAPISAPDASVVRDTLNALSSQTKAVEDAVQEVMAVQAQ